MQNLNKLSKIILSLTMLFFVMWLGGYITRHLVIYQFFEPENLDLRQLFTEGNLSSIFNLVLPVLVLNIVSFLGFLLFYFTFIFTSKISLKKEGWLFIVTMIIIITAPFEIYLLSLDYKTVESIMNTAPDNKLLFNQLRDRITILSSFSLIEIFSYFGAIFLSIFRPFRKK